MTNLPSELNERPTDLNVANAQLPKSYESAKQALSLCSSIDECQEWANKAEAIASYARMAKDEALLNMAKRIRARAIRRAGEMLEQIDGRGGDRSKKGATDPSAQGETQSRGTSTLGTQSEAADNSKSRGAPTSASRRKVAAAAGMSKDQQVAASRVAKVPEDDFEKQVESETPPSVTKLADQGKKQRPNGGLGESWSPPAAYSDATQLMDRVSEFAVFCNKNAPERIAEGVLDHEVGGVRQSVATIDGWLDRFVVNLRSEK